MIVEHTFVTTLDAERAFALASELLAPLRFRSEPADKPGARQWRRGARSARKSRGLSDMPSRVRMEFDRGRVVVAAALEHPGARAPALPAKLAVGLTVALERALAGRAALSAARADCVKLDAILIARDWWRDAAFFALAGVVALSILGMMLYTVTR